MWKQRRLHTLWTKLPLVEFRSMCITSSFTPRIQFDRAGQITNYLLVSLLCRRNSNKRGSSRHLSGGKRLFRPPVEYRLIEFFESASHDLAVMILHHPLSCLLPQRPPPIRMLKEAF